MPDSAFAYSGSELDVFAAAANWRSYWGDQVRPFQGRRVLEVGAGIGSVTRALCHPGVERWVALEPDAGMAGHLASIAADGFAAPVSARRGTVADLDTAERFDSVLYIDVLEHIADDDAELRRVAGHVDPGGHIVVLSPAHQFLYTPFDAAIGHHRRYDRASLRRLAPGGCRLVTLRYLDSVGMLASLGNRLLLKSAHPKPAQIALWDRCMVPLSRRLDPLTGYRCGKSLLAVWRKDPVADGAVG
ncbi:methyltransferase domain-containing protein [Azospirillum formosense]|uniref:Methyltransferase domain-containing protein n=1 Tax=Azospirillum formosense TaxID=861533 RepID=A0ABX2L6B5_9PROT|nr:methyltransferase domain-containing protein [Azospirillum formosense]MBY3757641.1 methyltransferase domain-containing protein [Azospirillum formosense]NUB22679.1 methyltransferase domain-containing protein [Azospirillum formosense]